MNACKSRTQVLSVWKRYTVMQNNNEFRNACIEMGKNILKRNDKISKVPCGFQ